MARGYLLNEDDRIHQYVIQQIMCNFRVSGDEVTRKFGVSFREYFRPSLLALEELEGDGFVKVSEEGLQVTERGRLFVRNVCMAFDRYLQAHGKGKQVFSRTV